MKTKELQDIENALEAYYNKHNGNVVMNVSIFAFDDNNDILDNYLWLVGDKDILLVNNDCMIDEIEEKFKDDLAVSK